MREKLPRVPASKVTKVLERVRFVLARQSGSHKIYKNREGKRGNCPVSFRKNSTSQSLKKHP
jgi:predicted RNA binding protein YcfA (HicA-like mRNA interferase family)